MSAKEEINEPEEIPVLSMNGLIRECQNGELFKCSMCNQVFNTSEEDPIAHSMLCTGF